MNIEEAVEYLKNCLNDEYNFKNATRKKDKEAIETLLTAYEKEKEKNKDMSCDLTEMRADHIDESTMLKQIKLKLQEKNIPIETLLAEFERLEDLEDDRIILKSELEKEKEKNKELTEERKKYPIAMNDEQYKKVIELAQKDIKEELDRQINVRIVNEEFIENNFISKDKIKAKIEELEKEKNIIQSEMDFEAFYRIKDLKNIEIEVLQSLLEKE